MQVFSGQLFVLTVIAVTLILFLGRIARAIENQEIVIKDENDQQS